jgi:hypothetical protein
MTLEKASHRYPLKVSSPGLCRIVHKRHDSGQSSEAFARSQQLHLRPLFVTLAIEILRSVAVAFDLWRETD